MPAFVFHLLTTNKQAVIPRHLYGMGIGAQS